MSATQPGLLVTGLPRSGTSWVGQDGRGRPAGRVRQRAAQRPPPTRPLARACSTPTSPTASSTSAPTTRTSGCSAFRRDPGAALRRRPRAAAQPRALRPRPDGEVRDRVHHRSPARPARHARRPVRPDCAVPWLAEHFGVRSVVLVRDPVSLVGSYRKLNWHIHLDELLGQPLLTRDLLGRPRRRAARGGRRGGRGPHHRAAVAGRLRRGGPRAPARAGRARAPVRGLRAAPRGGVRSAVRALRPDLRRAGPRPCRRGDDRRRPGLAPRVRALRAVQDGVPADGLAAGAGLGAATGCPPRTPSG